MIKNTNIILALLTSTTISSMAVDWDIGFGANHGGLLGITANQMVADDIEVYGGVALIGGVVGTRYYIDEHIRFDLNYGVNGYGYNKKDGESYFSTYHGVNVGLDYIWEDGYSLGITAALSQNEYKTNKSKVSSSNSFSETKREIEEDDDSKPFRIGISFGYRF